MFGLNRITEACSTTVQYVNVTRTIILMSPESYNYGVFLGYPPQIGNIDCFSLSSIVAIF
jgi:hypothetical protein